MNNLEGRNFTDRYECSIRLHENDFQLVVHGRAFTSREVRRYRRRARKFSVRFYTVLFKKTSQAVLSQLLLTLQSKPFPIFLN